MLLQNFQRIQRNRQSRIRVKLCRRAGKRQDEVLVEEEEVSPPPPLAAVSPPSIIGDDAEQSVRNNDDIDIVGEEVNTIVPTKTAATAGEKSTGMPQLLHLYYF